jgi:hypothetical protein
MPRSGHATMKLPIMILVGMLGAVGVARADAPIDPYAPHAARQPRPVGPLRAALLARFDANHDGRLEPNERRHAIRALRRLARQMARQERRRERAIRKVNGVIRRYDRNGDGVVGPDEAPPRVQQRLRHLDRNRDGWVDDADF